MRERDTLARRLNTTKLAGIVGLMGLGVRLMDNHAHYAQPLASSHKLPSGLRTTTLQSGKPYFPPSATCSYSSPPATTLTAILCLKTQLSGQASLTEHSGQYYHSGLGVSESNWVTPVIVSTQRNCSKTGKEIPCPMFLRRTQVGTSAWRRGRMKPKRKTAISSGQSASRTRQRV